MNNFYDINRWGKNDQSLEATNWLRGIDKNSYVIRSSMKTKYCKIPSYV